MLFITIVCFSMISLSFTADQFIPVSITTSTISISVSPTSVILGNSVAVYGGIKPWMSELVTIVYTRPDNTIVTNPDTSNYTGVYQDIFIPDAVGVWMVQASWAGNSVYNAVTSEMLSFSVITAEQYWSPIFKFDYAAVKLRNWSDNTSSAWVGLYNASGVLSSFTTIEILPHREIVTLNRIGNLRHDSSYGSVEVITDDILRVSLMQWDTYRKAVEEFVLMPLNLQALNMFWFIVPKPNDPNIAITNPNPTDATISLRIYASDMNLKGSQTITVPGFGEQTINIMSLCTPRNIFPAVVKVTADEPVVVRYPGQKDY
jgi:hypothetical protein